MGQDTNSSKAALRAQAQLFSHYLIGKAPNIAARKIYIRSIGSQYISATPNDLRILSYAINHSWSIRYIDTYLALFNPSAELRRRIFIMFAILECMPEYTEYFLPRKHPALYIFTFAYVGITSFVNLIIGTAIVRFVI